MKRVPLLLALILLPLACVHAELKVASLSTITSDIASNVGGDKVTVIPIIRPGIDPHEFEPTPREMEQIAKADLVLITGKGIEAYLAKLQQAMGGKEKFVDVGKAFPSLKLESEGQKIEDPHWWHSIENMKKAVVAVENRFIATDPENKATYEKNAAAYLLKLTELEKWARLKIAQLPATQRKLVTSHDAFQYFARDYGFTIYSVQGISTDDQPSSKKIRDLIDTIKRENVKAVFFENIENPKVVAEITRESGARVGGALYADGLGDKVATTYPDMVRYNITTIVDSLK
ncbi:MAG: metal ABC transporter substrate-binding protein [Chthoniobacterales bacterium]